MRRVASAALAMLCLLGCGRTTPLTDWYTPVRENKPFVRWWWLGSAVDSAGISYNLKEFADAGIGGFEVTPIYGVKGNESRNLDYLSPEWMQAWSFLCEESERLGLECDLNGGTGWPFGGPQIPEELAAQRMEITPGGVESRPTGQMVKRAAPGGEGLVMDHLNPDALRTYLARFDDAFAGQRRPEAWFNDSYEVFGADWTPAFPEYFESRYGYDIRPYLLDHSLPGYREAVCDYRECIGQMLLENFLQPWVDWCHRGGSLVRNQAHGSPANLLDAYAVVDIPECETFGRTPFDIPGLRKDPIIKVNDGTVAALKFASSAAHVTGKPYVSCETLTWLTEHFRTSLSQAKPELDKAFTAGVNHVVFHGAPYSPEGARFPGWMFYAAVNMSPTGGMWRDAPALFKYVERCQAFLSAGSPDADFLLYFPVYDLWNSASEWPYMPFDIHSLGWRMPEFIASVESILGAGFDVDYISDKQLLAAKVDRPVIVPPCSCMPPETAQRLARLIRRGVPVYFMDRLPSEVPGLRDTASRRKALLKAVSSFGNSMSLQQILSGYTPEAFKTVYGGDFIRRRNESGGWNYFLTVLRDTTVNGWVSLATPAASAMLFDPLSGRSGKAELRQGTDGNAEIRLQLGPGESLLVKTFPVDIDAPGWQYIRKGEPMALDRQWILSFPESDPPIPGEFVLDGPLDWTTLPVPEAKVNFGTALYSTVFRIDDPGSVSDWELDLGDVRESARVRVNGRDAGTVFAVPFRLRIGELLKEGENTLEVEVTNLQSNRIADYDRRGVEWKIFEEINVVNIWYGKADYSGWRTDPSGLCGPVKLYPCYLARK